MTIKFTDVESENFLKHYGVKGMRWGVRKRSSQGGPSGPAEPAAPRNRKTGNLDLKKTKGGQGFDASDDAIRTARSKQIAKKSGVQALSTKELQDLVKRMQLEGQFKEILAKNPTALQVGQKMVGDILKKEVQSTLEGKEGPLTKVLKDAKKVAKK